MVARILALRDPRLCGVGGSPDAGSCGTDPTYIYGAAIPLAAASAAGLGVAIVFDSGPQFAAMLKDALPRDGAGTVKHGAFALFADRDGRVIACSDDHFGPAIKLSIDAAFLGAEPGAGHSGVTVLGDTHYAVGAKASSGYREYKGPADCYRNDVDRAGVRAAVRGETRRAPSRRCGGSRSARTARRRAPGGVASFLIGRKMVRRARASEIVEAIGQWRAWSRCRSCRPAWRGA